MDSVTSTSPSLREMTREAVRARVADTAIELFAEHGFDQVTVEQVAAAVGMSPRSFNRYFPTKEDAVLGNAVPWGEYVRKSFAERPIDEPVWESLRVAFESLLGLSESQGERQKRVMRVLMSTASLRARNLEKHLAWADMLSPLVADRLDGADRQLRALTIVQAGLACFDIALTSWADPGEDRAPATLLAISFGELRP
jgi:AcrR family transcriptional regulator